MTIRERIYLDNAATSWPKPEAVYAAVNDYQRRLGASAGRGAYATGQEVERGVASARRQIAMLIGARHPWHIAFGLNGTDVLNTAIHGMLRDGDHVVTSVVEHNSVLRPLRWLAEHRGVRVSYVNCNSTGVIDPDDVARAIEPRTQLVVIGHASNVTGALQPIGDIARHVHERKTILLVDAAQSLGHVPLDVEQLGIDILASSGHKGMLGPLGTGVLYVSEKIADRVESFRQGGTGTSSEDDRQPDDLPHKFEAGNLNVAGILGLGAGAAWISERSIMHLHNCELQLVGQMIEGLEQVAGVTLYGPRHSVQHVGVVSFNVRGYEPQEVASMLDATKGIEVRAGLHCAPRMHEALGTMQLGGTVRMSVGPFNTHHDIVTAIDAVSQLAAATGELREP